HQFGGEGGRVGSGILALVGGGGPRRRRKADQRSGLLHRRYKTFAAAGASERVATGIKNNEMCRLRRLVIENVEDVIELHAGHVEVATRHGLDVDGNDEIVSRYGKTVTRIVEEPHRVLAGSTQFIGIVMDGAEDLVSVGVFDLRDAFETDFRQRGGKHADVL